MWCRLNTAEANNTFSQLLRCVWLALGMVLSATAHAEPWDIKGHVKYRFHYTHYPDDSLLTQELGSQNSYDHFGDIRLMSEKRWDNWDVNVDYQLIGIAGDSLQVVQDTPQAAVFFTPGRTASF